MNKDQTLYTICRQRFQTAMSGLFESESALELFNLFNHIALLTYEEAANSGFLIISPADMSRESYSIRFEKPFDLRNVRGIRKMLQMTGADFHLVCDGRWAYGFTAPKRPVTSSRVLQFRPSGTWELRQGDCVLLEVAPPMDAIARGVLNENRFREDLEIVFGPLLPVDTERLWSLASSAARQLRGTNVLISAEAAPEALRLQTQCTRITPTYVTPALIEHLTSIDGTVIIDTHGVCHAIGAILDGKESARGDRSRGGRYNSALMYVDSVPYPSLIIVVSQDRMVDLVWANRESAGNDRLVGPT